MTAALPYGDPEEMRTLAQLWRRRAAELAELGRMAAGALGSAGFSGPAATRLAETAEALGQEALQAGRLLETFAADLVADAQAVEEMNTEAAREAAATAAEAAGVEREPA